MKRTVILNTVLILSSLVYPLYVAYDLYFNGFPADPIADWMHGTGKGALIFLFLSISIRPFRKLIPAGPMKEFRRTTGLIAFSYALLHAFIFFVVDFGLDLNALKDGFLEKPYAILGFLSLLIMIPLAITSTKGWVRRLGRNWKRLHSLVYLTALIAVLHYIWLVKTDVREPLVWMAVLILLIVIRLRNRKNKPGIQQSNLENS